MTVRVRRFGVSRYFDINNYFKWRSGDKWRYFFMLTKMLRYFVMQIFFYVNGTLRYFFMQIFFDVNRNIQIFFLCRHKYNKLRYFKSKPTTGKNIKKWTPNQPQLTPTNLLIIPVYEPNQNVDFFFFFGLFPRMCQDIIFPPNTERIIFVGRIHPFGPC